MGESEKEVERVKRDESYFKSCLRSYRWMEKQIQELYFRVQELEHALTGLSRSSIELTPEQQASSKPMPHFSGGSGKSMAEKITDLDSVRKELTGLCSIKRSIDEVLSRMSQQDRKMVMDYFCDHRSADSMAMAYGYSNRKALHRHMDSVIRQSI